MTKHEALTEAADYIATAGVGMDLDLADKVATALYEIADDYFGEDIAFAAFCDIVKRGGFKLVVEPIA